MERNVSMSRFIEILGTMKANKIVVEAYGSFNYIRGFTFKCINCYMEYNVSCIGDSDLGTDLNVAKITRIILDDERLNWINISNKFVSRQFNIPILYTDCRILNTKE